MYMYVYVCNVLSNYGCECMHMCVTCYPQSINIPEILVNIYTHIQILENMDVHT